MIYTDMKNRYMPLMAALITAASATAQNTVVVAKSQYTYYEGNESTCSGIIMGSYRNDDVRDVRFTGADMVVTTKNGTQTTYGVADIERVQHNTKGLNRIDIFLPPSLEEYMDFDTSLDTPDAERTEGYAEVEFQTKRTVSINYNGSTVTVTGDTEGMQVNIDGADVSITSTDEGVEYIITGESMDCSLTLNNSAGAQVRFDNASVHNIGAATITATGDLLLTTAPSTRNRCGAVKAAGSLTFHGKGALNIVTTADDLHAAEADNLTVAGGTLNVYTGGDRACGLLSHNDLTITNGSINIITTGTAPDDSSDTGSTAMKCLNASVSGGKIRIKTLGVYGGQGLTGENGIAITGGELAFVCNEDVLKADHGKIEILGGRHCLISSVDDCVNCADGIKLENCELYAVGPYPEESPFDNNGKAFTTQNARFFAIGSKSDKPITSKTKQPYLFIKKTFIPDNYVRICDMDDNEIATYATPVYANLSTKKESQATILFSFPDMEKLTNYKVYTAPSIQGGTEHWGEVTGATLVGATLVDTVESTKCKE